MGVGLGQGLVAFLSGVQEGAEKIDEKMAANMKRIQESNPDENLKSRYLTEFTKYEEDVKLIDSIRSLGTDSFSGISTEKGQSLAGGYASVEEYREAKKRAEAAGKDLYHNLPELGEAPVFTPSTYGLGTIKKDGTTRTTLSKTFNKLFRPEVFDENQTYADTQVDTKGSLTTYRRGKSQETSKEDQASLTAISSEANKISKQETLSVNKIVEGVMMTHELQLTDDTESLASVAAAELGFKGYMLIGDPTRTNAMSTLEEKLSLLGEAPSGDDKEALQLWQKGYNKILFGVTSLENSDGPTVGTITSGVFNDKGVKVNVQYTGESTDNFMNMEGYRQFGGGEPADTIKIGTQREYYNKESNTIQSLYYTGKDTDIHEGLTGWAAFGDAKSIKEDNVSLQTTHNNKNEEVKIYYTGLDTEIWEGDVGWVQVGDAKKTPATSLSSADLKWEPMQVILDAIGSGTTLNERQLEQGRLVYMRSEDAIGMKYEEILNAYDTLTLMVRDFKFMSIKEKNPDGSFTGKTIRATSKAIEQQAEYRGTTTRKLRKILLKAYNDNNNKAQ